ncbi:glycosyltransferase family 2 protein [Winogradskyella sp. E313]|uniref:Glycosyltransferase family 2 protein n=1 Tax=Winogradskyella immobilis TaxID=2816852 RepID=A0ABS8EPT1_9FLAO|nr:glycosyltransferase family 2 protein [Winogradskyella immobilis]
MPKSVLEHLQGDATYKSEIAKSYDLAWQAIHKGYISDANTIQTISPIPLHDEYVFIRKNFSSVWVFYVLLIRIFSFKKPFKEFRNWFITRSTNRFRYIEDTIVHDGWEQFQSQLIAESPKVSVVIPTLNRYHYLKDVLKDFEKQDYTNFEIIVVDQSEPFNSGFYDEFKLNINVIKQAEKALWLARNTAIRNASGKFIALSEDDVRIESDWISKHLKCIDFFKADISAGVFYPEGQNLPKARSFFMMASQFATGNAMLYKSVFKEIGLFDRQFEKQRMGDGEFGLRAYLNGFKSISNPEASCIDVKADVGGLREMGSWDAFRTKKWFAPRPIPSVLYFFRKYFGNKAAKYALMRTVPLSIMPYQFKKNKAMLIIGALVSILILPIVIVQVLKSWRMSNIKLREGELIERLN